MKNNSCISITLILLLFFIIGNTIAQPGSYNFNESSYLENWQYQTQNSLDTIFNKSEIIVRNASKDTLEISKLKNGKKHGLQKLFYNNGEIKAKVHFKNGLPNGKSEFFTQPNTILIRTENYKALPKENRSVLHGLVQTFQYDGKLVEKIRYKNGKKDGKYQTFHSNGNLNIEGSYKEDLEFGKKLTYHNNGILLRDENFIIIKNPDYIKLDPTEGKPLNTPTGSSKREVQVIHEKLSVLDGKITYYYSNGQLQQVFNYKAGKKHGVCIAYYQDKTNSIRSKQIFKADKEHGAYSFYFSNGNLERQGIYYAEKLIGDSLHKNVYEGKIYTYHQNGTKSKIENWKDYKRNGVQETYYYNTGELQKTEFFEDNLKTGKEERFDREGNTIYVGYFEIAEVDGHRVSQQVGTETYWEKDMKTTVEWENGKVNGPIKNYYENGQLKELRFFEDGELKEGTHQTFYKNGQIKTDYYRVKSLYSNSYHSLGWNTRYDERGQITYRFLAKGNGENIIEESFSDGMRTSIHIQNILNISFTDSHKLAGINWLGSPGNYSFLGFKLFKNGKVRKIHLQDNEQKTIVVNFTSEGDLIQMRDLTDKYTEKTSTKNMAEQVLQQYNPDWEEEKLLSKNALEGRYEWFYKDGKPFFEIEFKDGIPQGKWTVYNPIIKDTLLHAEFDKGLPQGKWVKKTLDGSLEYRKEFTADQKLKKYYEYWNNGLVKSFNHNDTTGQRLSQTEYYSNGKLKKWSDETTGSYLNMNENGDTLNYSILFTEGDSIRIEKQFYEGKIVRSDRRNNWTSGMGIVKSYFDNGQLRISQELKDNVSHGAYELYDEQAKLIKLGAFKGGKRDGEWVSYNEDGTETIDYYKDGEIIIPEITTEDRSCRCYDTTLPSSQIGFANSLAYMSEYSKIKKFFPKSIIPIDSLNYESIFVVNFIANSSRDNGFVRMKLLPYKELSFYYPSEKYFKIILNPCPVDGYINNMDVNLNYSYRSEQLVYGQISPKRIGISIENNPLVDAVTKQAFTAYYDVQNIGLNEKGIDELKLQQDVNACYPLGVIHNFLKIDIQDAVPIIHSKLLPNIGELPLKPNEYQNFNGLAIRDAMLEFDYVVDKKVIPIMANSNNILVATNFVVVEMELKGEWKDEEVFLYAKENKALKVEKLKEFLEAKGLYRISIVPVEDSMYIRFFVEK